VKIKELKEKELERQILLHRSLYYQGKPVLTDQEYDDLEDHLKALNPNHPLLFTIGHSSFLSSSFSPSSSSSKLKHEYPMLSLQKTYLKEELELWRQQEEVLGTYKIDGVSCSLIYENGILSFAKTRGDGEEGEDILEKCLYVPSLPSCFSDRPFQGEVRGELYCSEERFLFLIEKMEELGLERPSSPRNIVAGLLSRKDFSFLCEYLDFFSFDFFPKKILREKENFLLESDKWDYLSSYGFSLPPYEILKTKEEIEKFLQKIQEFIAEGEYAIDGAVFVLNSLQKQSQQGFTAHHPKFKMAFKFKGDCAVATILEIEWFVSRQGILTPVANITPTFLSGATLRYVSLHNWGIVKQYKLSQGVEIEIIRSGEVIPKFIRVISSKEQEPIFPLFCPECSTKIKEEGIRLFCENKNCKGKKREEIIYFCSIMEMRDLGPQRIKDFFECGLISTLEDLYLLKEEELLLLEGVQEKLAQKIINSIEKSRLQNLHTFLAALGISGLGKTKWKKILRSLDVESTGVEAINLFSLSVEKLSEVEGMGIKSATECLESLLEKRPLIEKLLPFFPKFLEKRIIIEENFSEEGHLKGKKIAITGALSITREEMIQKIEERGGVFVNSVSSKTDILLIGKESENSSKYKKARELKITILKEEELF